MANLLERASVVLTPTAYNNGEALCIKPDDASGDFQFSRNSAATRVNAQGLVENVQILSSNLVQNGDFSEEGVEEVSNGSFSQEGVEQVTNGDFATDSDWTKGSGWTISGGSANYDGLQAYQLLRQGTANGVIGKTFLVKYDVSNNNGTGGIYAKFGGVSLSGYNTDNGSFEFYVEAISTDYIRFTPQLDFNGSIDNCSVREVGQDWVLTSGAAIGENKLDINANAYDYFARQLDVSTIGKTYKVSVDAEIDSGRMILYLADTNAFEVIDTSGSYTFYIVADGTQIRFRAFDTALVGSITNISVKEVGQNWTLGTGWSIGEDKALSDTTASNLTPSTTLISGEKYKFTLDVAKISAGSFTFLLRFNGTNTTFATINTEGSFTFYATADATGFRLQNLSGGTTDFSVTNITAVQITDDTNLPRINYEGFSYQDALGSELVTGGDFSNPSDWNLSGQNLSISNGKGISTGSNFGAQFKQTILTINKTYKLVFDIVDYTSGAIGLTANYYGVQQTFNSVGTHTAYFTSLNQTELRLYSENFIGSIDNVSVKEITGQEVVPDSGCGSWLWEPQSTNTILISNSVSTMNYSSNITKIDNAAISPDSTFNSMIFTPTATSGIHRTGYSTTAGLYAQNDIVTFSGFVKANGYNFVTMGGFFGQEKAVFNISNGTLVSQESNVINTEIVKLTNDWYRISTTYTFQNSIGNGYLYAGIYVMDTATGYAFTADGVSGVYGYGFQAELGTGTSYIPTEGSQVTRNQDVCTNGGSLATINSTEGVLYAEIAALADGVGTRTMSLSDGTANNSITIRYTTSVGVIQAFVVSGGSFQFNANISGVSVLDFNKVAIKYSLNDMALWINGVEVATDTSGTMPLGLNEINFTRGDGANKFFGKTKAVAVWKEALSDSELQSLTTI